MFDLETERPWLFRKINSIIKEFNITKLVGRILSEGDNNYSNAIVTGIILNMTHYMYNRTDFLPGVPTPLLGMDVRM
jgi:hypothetical protein